jgi:polysaccharide export outer membrane protein
VVGLRASLLIGAFSLSNGRNAVKAREIFRMGFKALKIERENSLSVFHRCIGGVLMLALAACSSLGSSGPSSSSVNSANGVLVANSPIRVIDINDLVALRVARSTHVVPLSVALGDAAPTNSVIGRGDLLSVTIWEAPPALLFGGSTSFTGGGGGAAAAGAPVGQNSSIPEMMVDQQGDIRLPFAGTIEVEGRTPGQVERAIQERLQGIAHDPQVSVRIAQNSSSAVTVIGDVKASGRVPITPKGERILDVIESAGGVNQPVNETTVEVTRDGRTAAAPLEAVIRNPAENIRVGPKDVVTVLFKPYSFTALGATNTSAQIPFESTGISLAEALARAGGLNSERANARGAFVFRFEQPDAVDPAIAAVSPRTPDGRIPVIYRADLRNPATVFAAQHFPMRDKDVLFVSTAPLSDLQRFVSILSSMAFTLIGLGQAVPGVP